MQLYALIITCVIKHKNCRNQTLKNKEFLIGFLAKTIRGSITFIWDIGYLLQYFICGFIERCSYVRCGAIFRLELAECGKFECPK